MSHGVSEAAFVMIENHHHHQVQLVCDQLMADPLMADGHSAVGISQGGLLIR